MWVGEPHHWTGCGQPGGTTTPTRCGAQPPVIRPHLRAQPLCTPISGSDLHESEFSTVSTVAMTPTYLQTDRSSVNINPGPNLGTTNRTCHSSGRSRGPETTPNLPPPFAAWQDSQSRSRRPDPPTDS